MVPLRLSRTQYKCRLQLVIHVQMFAKQVTKRKLLHCTDNCDFIRACGSGKDAQAVTLCSSGGDPKGYRLLLNKARRAHDKTSVYDNLKC